MRVANFFNVHSYHSEVIILIHHTIRISQYTPNSRKRGWTFNYLIHETCVEIAFFDKPNVIRM